LFARLRTLFALEVLAGLEKRVILRVGREFNVAAGERTDRTSGLQGAQRSAHA
jgi:hypothetical protein